MAVDRTNTIQILHSPTAETNSPANAAAGGLTLAKGELAWQDQGTGGANGKLWIGDATAAGAVERHIGGVGTGATSFQQDVSQFMSHRWSRNRSSIGSSRSWFFNRQHLSSRSYGK